MPPITISLLNSYLGHHIDDICPFKFQAPNNCAHFVSHVLSLHFGYCCSTSPAGGNIRVHEVFMHCPDVGQIYTCPPPVSPCLIFVTHAGTVNLRLHEREKRTGTPMSFPNVPKKHIGIAVGEMIWHYSNSHQRVACESADDFLHHYPKQENGLWYGTIPMGARPAAFDSSLSSSLLGN